MILLCCRTASTGMASSPQTLLAVVTTLPRVKVSPSAHLAARLTEEPFLPTMTKLFGEKGPG